MELMDAHILDQLLCLNHLYKMYSNWRTQSEVLTFNQFDESFAKLPSVTWQVLKECVNSWFWIAK